MANVVTQSIIIVMSPPFPEGRAFVSLEINQQPVPCEDSDNVIFDFVTAQKGALLPASTSVPQTDPTSEKGTSIPISTEQFPNLNPSYLRDDFYHLLYDPAFQLTPEILEEAASRPCFKREGFTRLMIAAYVGDMAMVEKMIEDEEDPAYTDSQQWTALDWAKEARKTFPQRDYPQVLSFLEVCLPECRNHTYSN